jgi:hypothetical protein
MTQTKTTQNEIEQTEKKLLELKEKNSTLYEIFEGSEKSKKESDNSCDNEFIPCMIEFKEDLILKEDTEFIESIKVNGSIKGNFNLKVAGDINARDINARNIDAWNIDAWDIDARDINALDINARDIICEIRIKKEVSNKTISRIFIKDKLKLERKEQMP